MSVSKQVKSRSGKFIKDLKIYAIGNIGSKLITFLLVPFYTRYVNPAEFGYYDICFTVVFCLCPFILFQLNDGSFRFLLETKDVRRQGAVLTFTFNTIARNAFVICALGVIVSICADVRYLWFVVMFSIAQSVCDEMLQTMRGLGQTGIYVKASIANSFLCAAFSVVFVASFKWGVPGIFTAYIISRVIVSAYMMFKVKLFKRYYNNALYDKALNRSILRYCLPLLPTMLFMALLNSNNLFIIQHYLGLWENGIYAVLAKFTGILYVISNIFTQTWQQSAIEQYDSPDRNEVFSKIFNCYFYLFCGLVIFFPFGLRINYCWLVSSDYSSSSGYLFANSVYMMCFAMSLFFELGYQCAKQTARILPGLVLASVINVTFNYLLIGMLGIWGVILSGILTYGALTVYRVIDTRKYMVISFDKKNIVGIALMGVAAIIYHMSASVAVDVAASMALLMLYIWFAPVEFKVQVIGKLLHQFNMRRA